MKINDLVRLNRIVTEMQEQLELYGKYCPHCGIRLLREGIKIV